jgi:hypothetical protein
VEVLHCGRDLMCDSFDGKVKGCVVWAADTRGEGFVDPYYTKKGLCLFQINGGEPG